MSVDNSIEQIDSLTGAVVATYATGVTNDGVASGRDGSLYVADYYNNQILHYDATGTLLSRFGSSQLIAPQGLSFGPDGNLYVTNTNGPNNGFVDEFSPAGAFIRVFIPAGSGGLSNAKAIVWGPDGNTYVSSFNNSEVIRYNGTTGAFMNVFATGTGGFEDITFGPDKNLYVASYYNFAVYRYDGSTGAPLGKFTFGPISPYGLRFDTAGNLDVSFRTQGQIRTFNAATGAFMGILAQDLINPSYMASTTTLVTTEAGTSASFSLVLESPPTADVTITLSSTNPGQGSLSRSTVTFTPANWNVAQTVTVTGLSDHMINGDQTYQINGAIASTDMNYNGLVISPIVVVNKEADVAGFTVSPTSIQTSMAGGAASFSVALTSQPSAPVTIYLNSTKPSEGTLSQSVLSFDATNWNVAQTITVTGQNDLLALGNVTYQINGTASSPDPNYSGLAMTPVNVTNVNSILPGFIVNPISLTTSESGTSASFNVTLASIPAGNVTVNLANGNPAQGTLSTSSLTFTILNWNVAQTVTVTGLDDHVVNGNQTYQIMGSATSIDPLYNGLAITPVTVVNQEADVAGFIVTPTSLTTSETGTSASFAVTLTSQPTSTVTINLINGNPAQGSLSTNVLTFDATNWNVAQSVTVTGLDDHIVNGNQIYQIMGRASSADAVYNGMNITPVTVVNQEADVAGFIVTPTSLTTSETGTSAAFMVSLTSKPTATVTINLTNGNPAQGSLSKSMLTFDATNWNVAQTVTVIGLDDHIVNGNQTYQITGVAVSVDPLYNGRSIPPVTVVNQEADVAGFIVTPTSLTTTEAGGSASFGVALTMKPTAAVTIMLNSGNPAQGSLSTTVLTFDASNWNVAQSVTVTGLNDHIVNGSQTYQISGTVVSIDIAFNAKPFSPITVVNNAIANVNSPVPDPVGLPTPPKLPVNVPISALDPVIVNLNAILNVGEDVRVASTTLAGILATATPVVTRIIGQNGIRFITVATVTPVNELQPNNIEVLPPLTEKPSVQLPDPVTIQSNTPPIQAPPTAPPQSRPTTVQRIGDNTLLWEELDMLDEQVQRTGPRRIVDVAALIPLVASVGYILLNARSLAFLMSLLTARPLWKRFDPLEVLFLWEEEKKRKKKLAHPEADEDEETLQSLVVSKS